MLRSSCCRWMRSLGLRFRLVINYTSNMRLQHACSFHRLTRLIIQWMDYIYIFIRNDIFMDQALRMQLILRSLPYPREFICIPILNWIHSEIQLSFRRQLQRLPFAKRNALKIYFYWFFLQFDFLLALDFCVFLRFFAGPRGSTLIWFVFLLLAKGKHESSWLLHLLFLMYDYLRLLNDLWGLLNLNFACTTTCKLIPLPFFVTVRILNLFN